MADSVLSFSQAHFVTASIPKSSIASGSIEAGTVLGRYRLLEALGRLDEARAEYEAGRRLSGSVAGPSLGLAHLDAASGNEQEAGRILTEVTEARATRVAREERATGLILLRVHPRLDPIRDDPRYPPLVRQLGLESAIA